MLTLFMGASVEREEEVNKIKYIHTLTTSDSFNQRTSQQLSIKEFLKFVRQYLKNEIIMKEKVLEIINNIRAAKDMAPVAELHIEDNLRNDLGLTSFDLAELTVNIEDEFDIDIFESGFVNTIGEIYTKLEK